MVHNIKITLLQVGGNIQLKEDADPYMRQENVET